MIDGAFPLERYLARLGVHEPLAADAATLARLHEAHVAAIPFENLDILLGRGISLEPRAIFAKLVDARRGGYCFEQNALFQRVLEHLGYRVTALAARVHSDGGAVRPRTHMTLRVDTAAGPWLADVGFGGDGLVHPLPFAPDVETRVGPAGYRLVEEGAAWALESRWGAAGAWRPLYRFTHDAALPPDFEVANWYTSTHPSSPFTSTLTVQRAWRDRRVILRDRELTRVDEAGRSLERLGDREQLLVVLRREFALEFPSGTSFAKPDFWKP